MLLFRLSLLDVSRNQLAALPEGISCCTALVELLLEHNCLEQLPDSIQQLQSLRTLNIRGNRYSYLSQILLGMIIVW